MLTFRQILKKVQKPAYYTGGELGSVVKEKTPDLLRYAFCSFLLSFSISRFK